MDKIYTFIGLQFDCSKWNVIGNFLRSNYLDYINLNKCQEQSLPSGFETECHCTIYYNSDKVKGVNWLTYYLVHNCLDELESIMSTKLDWNTITLDTFDNDDSRVLKLNLEYSNLAPYLTILNTKIQSELGGDNYGKYSPHITLTYLNSDTSNEVIDSIVENFNFKWILDLTQTGIKISDGITSVIDIKP